MTMEDGKREDREFIRVEYTVDVLVETSDMTLPTSEGKLCDISAQGAMLIIDRKLHSGLPVRLHLKTKKDLSPLIGYVRWQKKVDDMYRVGIIFDEKYDERNDKIIEIITEEILNEIRRKQEKSAQ